MSEEEVKKAQQQAEEAKKQAAAAAAVKADFDTGLAALQSVVEEPGPGLVLANLVDFDTLYGHRNDPEGYAGALRSFDDALAGVLRALRPDDLLIVSADHGNDPTTPTTDHSRELVPLLVTGEHVGAGRDLGLRATFADVAATVAELLSLAPPQVGTSFAREL